MASGGRQALLATGRDDDGALYTFSSSRTLTGPLVAHKSYKRVLRVQSESSGPLRVVLKKMLTSGCVFDALAQWRQGIWNYRETIEEARLNVPYYTARSRYYV